MSRYRRIVRAVMSVALPGMLALAMYSPGHSQPAASAAQTIRLSHIAPSQFVSELVGESGQTPHMVLPPLPSGIDQISPNDIKGTVTVRGESADIEKVQQLARLLDAPSERIRLNVKVVREQSMTGPVPSGLLTSTADGVTEITNGSTGKICLYGSGRLFVANLTPHRTGDGSVLLSASVDMCLRQKPGTENRETIRGEWILSKKTTAASDLRIKSPDEPNVDYRIAVTAQ